MSATDEVFYDFMMDSQLNIRTTGRNDKHSDTHRYPYEPTAYKVLERIAESEYITETDVVLDYGCGLGRVPIYLHHLIGCQAIGIEMMKDFYKKACENAQISQSQEAVTFVCGKAEKYKVPDEVTVCFFFNPFDLGIMRGVLKRLLDSRNKMPRPIRLFFYFPQDEYVAFLTTHPDLEFVDEIDCTDVFKEYSRRNRVMIFEIP